jgi:hypothetical protein
MPPQTTRATALRYADLVTDFETTIGGVLDFLGLPPSDAVLNYDSYARANNLTPEHEMKLHALTLKKPDASRLFAFRDSLTAWERASLESLCADDMRHLLGLDPDYGEARRLTARAVFLAALVSAKGRDRLRGRS